VAISFHCFFGFFSTLLTTLRFRCRPCVCSSILDLGMHMIFPVDVHFTHTCPNSAILSSIWHWCTTAPSCSPSRAHTNEFKSSFALASVSCSSTGFMCISRQCWYSGWC
jgi:hypothetical protein